MLGSGADLIVNNIDLIIFRRAAEETEYQLQITRDASYSAYRLVHLPSSLTSCYDKSTISLLHHRRAAPPQTAQTAGPHVSYNFRMIDSGSKESLLDLERRRRESSSTSVSRMEGTEGRGNPGR